MFEYEGAQFTLEQVQQAADKRNLSLDDYISQFNITRLEGPLEEVPGKQTSQVPGAPAVKTAAPEDMASKPEDTSLGSQLIETKPPKKRLFGAPDMEPVYVEQEPLDITYTQATDKLKSALDTTDEELADYFSNSYFKLDKIPRTTISAGTGAPGVVQQVDVKGYLGEEKYDQYQDYLKDPVAFFNKLPGGLKSRYKNELKEQKSTRFFDSLEERERDVYKKLVFDSLEVVSKNFKSKQDLEYETDRFEKSINFSTEEAEKEGLVSYKDDIENLLSIQKEIESFTSNIDRRADVLEDAIKQNYISNRPDEAEKLQKFVFSLQTKLDTLGELEAQAFKKLEEKGYFEQEKNILKKQKELLDEIKINKVIYDNYGDISASISAASYEYDTRLKLISQLKTSLFNSVGNVASAATSSLSYLFDVWNEEGAAEALKILSETFSEFANDEIIKHNETYAPTPKVKDIKSLRDLQRWAGHVTADQSYNIAVMMAGGAAMNTLSRGGSTAAAIKNVKIATASALGVSSGSSQYSQMDIAQDLSINKIAELNSRIKASDNSIEKHILQLELDTQIYNRDLSQINKAWTAVGYGAAETLGEYFGTLGVLGRLSNFKRYTAGLDLKGQIGKLMAGQLVRGTAVENVEEIATALMQNGISYMGGDKNVNAYDNIDLDLLASTTLTSGILQGNSTISTAFSLMGNVAKTEAERKKFLEDGARLLELQGLQEEARRKKKKFQERPEMEKLLDKLGRDGSILVSKIGALSDGERTAVFENQSAIEAARARLRDLYAANLDQETTESRRKKIEQELKDLEAKKEILLSNVFSKKYLGKDFDKRVDKVVAENMDLDKFFGIFELSHNSSRVTIGDQRYVSVNNRDEFNSWLEKSKYNKEQKEALLTAYDEGRRPRAQADGIVTAGSNAQYIEDLDLVIVYNDNIVNSIYQNVKDGNMEAASITAVAPLEEVVHRQLFKSKNLNRENFIKAANSLFGLLDENKDKFEPKQYDYIQKRIAQYIEHFSNIKEYDTKEFTLAQEMFLTVANLVATKQIDPKSLSTKRTLKSLVDAFINDLNPNLSMYIQTGDADQTLRLVNTLYKKIQDGKLKASAVDDEESKLAKEIKAKAQSLGQKELNDRVDNLVGKKDENGNYQWKSKEEFQASEEFVNVYDKIINGNLIDPLIRRGIEGDVIYGKPVERFVEDVKDGLTGTLMRFDPTANNSLIGWINLQLGRRKGDVSNQYKKEFGEFGTTSIDIEAGEIGSLREIEAEDQAFDEAIDIQEEIIDETKGLIIPGVEVLGKETNQELIGEIGDMYADLQLEGKNYKNLPRLATRYVAEKAGVPETKITDPKKNLSSGEYASASEFLFNIADTYIKILPEGAVTQEAASEALKGTSTGVPKNILNFAYTRNEERFKDPAGLFVFEKRKDLTKEQFLDAIGLNPDGTKKPGITGRSPESQTTKGLLNLLDRIITNTAVRVVGSELGMSMNTQLDIRSGTVDGVYSLGVSAKQAAKDFPKFIDAAVSKLNDYGFGDQIQRVEDLSNAMRTSDGPAGLQNFFLDVLSKHNEFLGLAIRLVPDSIFGLGKNVTVAKAAFQHTPRATAAGSSYLDSKGNRLINEEWRERNVHKAFKYNSKSKDTTDNTSDIVKSLISNSELNKMLGVDFAKSKIISSKTRDLVNQFDADIKSIAPYSVTGINMNNWQAQMEKFDSAKWKKGITLANRILQSIIIDITNHFDPSINKGSTQEQFDQWLGYAINIYQGTTNDSNGFRKLSIVDVDKSYMYRYSEKNKRANALIGEHVPTNVDSMTDIMIDNLFKRRISSIIPTVYIIPQIDSKAKDSKKTGLKNANNVTAVDEFLAKRRALSRNQGRIIRYNKPGDLFPNKTKEQNFADIIYSLGTLETKFAGIISMKDARITPGQTLDLSTAKNLAAKRKKRFDVINPAANDFEGLMYALLAKGKLGEEQYEWMQRNLFEPYGQATYRLNNTRQTVARGLKKIEKENKELYKKLKKDSGFGGFTFEQALRVWLFSKIDKTPSGVDEDTKKALITIVKNNPDIEQLGYDLSAILPMKEFWVDPDPETWQIDSIRTDVINAIEKVARKQFLGEWKANVEEIFSKNNMNKLTAAFGEEYIDALKDMLYRMETGSSRPEGMNKQMNVFMNWVRGSVATTMFFNRRSAILQQISNVNFLNWGDNNPIAAAKAFANQKQYWEDFVYILDSNYLKERRGGLKTDINAAELAEAAKKHGYKGVLSKVLQAGFMLTQIGDSFAIATGGSTFYRNRISTYLKQGLTKEQAERKAFIDFQEISEETQQSARPDRLSQQQTNIIGRTFLSFQNTPMQMTRLSVRAGKDLLAGRGNPKEKVFKMLYYGAIQSIIFSMLQTALIGDMFSVFGDDEGDDEEELRAKKTKRVVNGVVDSFLKGTGMYGVAVATTKNAIIKFIEQEKRKEEGKRPDYAYVVLEVLNVSPPVGIKARNFYGALKNYEYNAKYIGSAGWDLNNPAIDIGSAALDALLNVPALSTVTTIRDMSAAFDEDLEVMTRLALIAGWHTWDLNLQDKELNKIKSEVKETNKKIRKSKQGFKKQKPKPISL